MKYFSWILVCLGFTFLAKAAPQDWTLRLEQAFKKGTNSEKQYQELGLPYIDWLLTQGADANIAMLPTLQKNDVDLLKLLLRFHADPNKLIGDLNTVFYATYYRAENSIPVLIAAGAEACSGSAKGRNVLETALSQKLSIPTISLFASRCSQFLSMSNVLFFQATLHPESLNVLEVLGNAGMQIEFEFLQQIRNGSITLARSLLPFYRDLNFQDSQGKTALHYLLGKGDSWFEITQGLLKKGASVEISEKSVFNLVLENNDLRDAKIILPYFTLEQSTTAFKKLMTEKNPFADPTYDFIADLVKAGVNPNTPRPDGKTLMDLAGNNLQYINLARRLGAGQNK